MVEIPKPPQNEQVIKYLISQEPPTPPQTTSRNPFAHRPLLEKTDRWATRTPLNALATRQAPLATRRDHFVGPTNPPRAPTKPPRAPPKPRRAGKSSLRAGKSPPRAGKSSPRAGTSLLRAGKSPPRAGKSPLRDAKTSPRARKSPIRASKSPSRAGKSPPRASEAARRESGGCFWDKRSMVRHLIALRSVRNVHLPTFQVSVTFAPPLRERHKVNGRGVDTSRVLRRGVRGNWTKTREPLAPELRAASRRPSPPYLDATSL